MRAIVVDDEKNVREALLKSLKIFCPEVEVVGEAESVEEASNLIRTVEFELAFLDIQLKDGTSLELLNMFPKRNFYFIFVTAFDQFAVDAFRLSAIDYLLKPISPDLLVEAVEKVKRMPSIEHATESLSVVQDHLQAKPKACNRIILKDADNMHVVKITDIVRCEADGGYTRFALLDGRRILTSHNLKEYERLLVSWNFIRAHHAHLVNVGHVLNFSRQDGGMLHMSNDEMVPVSHRKREALLRALQGGAIN